MKFVYFIDKVSHNEHYSHFMHHRKFLYGTYLGSNTKMDCTE